MLVRCVVPSRGRGTVEWWVYALTPLEAYDYLTSLGREPLRAARGGSYDRPIAGASVIATPGYALKRDADRIMECARQQAGRRAAEDDLRGEVYAARAAREW